MRHAKNTFKLGRTSSHRRCLIANMLKSLIDEGRIETTIAKAKEIRRHADRMITMGKTNTLHSRRQAIGRLMVRYNSLSSKDARQAKEGNKSSYNRDRLVIDKLFGVLAPRFANRNGGYTRIIKTNFRVGDAAPRCLLEFLPE